jgi:NADPH:quinone reductase-like Zn-dependent oxidoreductase
MSPDREMRAVRAYSAEPESLRVETLPVPAPAAGEVLVEVHAAAITADELTWPEEYPFIPAHDVSGVVTEVGADVDQFRAGDAVYGLIAFDREGAAAEYVTVAAADLAAKPTSVDHLSAAAVPLGALTAWQALVDHANVQKGQHVLIHGGSGGVGVYAIQLAAYLGANVTATASPASLDFVRDLGATTVIDYTTPFETQTSNVDAVIDLVGPATMSRSYPLLNPDGRLIAIAANDDNPRATYFIVEPNATQLTTLAHLIDRGALRPIIGQTFPLQSTQTAFTTQSTTHLRGKAVLDIR